MLCDSGHSIQTHCLAGECPRIEWAKCGATLPGSRSIQATRSKHTVWPGSVPGSNGQSAVRLCRDREASRPLDPNTLFGRGVSPERMGKVRCDFAGIAKHSGHSIQTHCLAGECPRIEWAKCGATLPGSRSIQATRSKHTVWPGSVPGSNGQSAVRLCRDRKAFQPLDPNTLFGHKLFFSEPTI